MSEWIDRVKTRFLLYRMRQAIRRLTPKLRRQLLVEETLSRRGFVDAARDAGVA